MVSNIDDLRQKMKFKKNKSSIKIKKYKKNIKKIMSDLECYNLTDKELDEISRIEKEYFEKKENKNIPQIKNSQIPRVVYLWREQSCDVYIGRECKRSEWKLQKSKWYNPYTIKKCHGSAKLAIELYRKYITSNIYLMSCLHELYGKTLGCWCKKNFDDPCHGDILVELVRNLLDKMKK